MENFDKTVLSFDESAYNADLEIFNDYAQLVTAYNQELKDEYQISLTNPLSEKIFLNFEPNPGKYFDTEIYNDVKSRMLRGEAREDVKRYISKCIQELKKYHNSARYALEIKKGVANVKETAKTALREKYENTLDTERSARLQQLHNEASHKINEFLSAVGENSSILFWTRFFQTTKESMTEPADFNYNNL